MWIYPGVHCFLQFLQRKGIGRLKDEKKEQLKKIYVGKGREELFYLYYGKCICIFVLTVSVFLLLISLVQGLGKGQLLLNQYYLERNAVDGTAKKVVLDVQAGKDKKRMPVILSPVSYTEKQAKKKIEQAKAYIEKRYLGKNASSEEVSLPLQLDKSVPQKGIGLVWRLDREGILNSDGTFDVSKCQKKQHMEIRAIFSYKDITDELVLQFTLLPVKREKSQIFWEEWQKEVDKNQENTKFQPYLELPQSVAGKKVVYAESRTNYEAILLGIFALLSLCIPCVMESQIKGNIQRREKELKMDYPEFVEHFVLLIGAGLNLKGAWLRIVQEYQEKRKTGKVKMHYLYEEMQVTCNEMEKGMSEVQAYELFGRRLGLLSYMKFTTLMVQNIRKGSKDLLILLEYEVVDAFRERKENAKTLGEEAGTKLLLPMMLMLVIVFVLIMYAAFQSM